MQNNQTPFVLVDWDKESASEEFRPTAHKIPQMVLKDNIKYLALNFKDLNQYLTPEEQEAAIKQWLPKLQDSPLEQLAILVPEKIIGQIVVRSIFLGVDPKELQILFLDEWEMQQVNEKEQ